MRSKAATTAPPERHASAPAAADVRASRLYLSRGTLFGLVRRAASIAALVVLDVVGLSLGLYAALVLRQVVYGETPIYWSLLWREGPQEWLPFLAPITVLLFLQAGLYASRERRPGPGRVLGSLVLVALVVLAFGLGTDYDFHTTGLIPTAVVTGSVAIGLLRAAYDSAALEAMRLAGIRRRVVLVGEGDNVRRLRAALASSRGGIPYEFLGAVSPEGEPGCRSSRVARGPRRGAGGDAAGRARPQRERLRRADGPARSRGCAPGRREGPSRTDDHGAPRPRRRVRPRPGRAAVRAHPPALTGADWALKRTFDVVASALLLLLLLPLWLLVALAIKLESRARALRRPPRRRRRARVRDAEVPHHDRRRRLPPGRVGGRERGLGSPVQDPRRPG